MANNDIRQIESLRASKPFTSKKNQPEWKTQICYFMNFVDDQATVQFTNDKSISGILRNTSGDRQSDILNSHPDVRADRADLSRILQDFLSRIYEWNESSKWNEPADAELEWYQESVGQQDNEPTTSEPISLSPSQIYSEILKKDSESDIPRLRELILLAEDTQFSAEESEKLGPWLLNYAENYRGSNDPQDEVVVWSAIRTGASMLTADKADLLLPLLEPGYPVETSLVALKMLGRVFEAQPPSDVDQYPSLAGEVLKITDALLKRYTITESSCAAKAHLAIYALAALGSTQLSQVVQIVLKMNTTWFTRRTLRKLRTLREEWNRREVNENPRINLEDGIKAFKAFFVINH